MTTTSTLTIFNRVRNIGRYPPSLFSATNNGSSEDNEFLNSISNIVEGEGLALRRDAAVVEEFQKCLKVRWRKVVNRGHERPRVTCCFVSQIGSVSYVKRKISAQEPKIVTIKNNSPWIPSWLVHNPLKHCDRLWSNDSKCFCWMRFHGLLLISTRIQIHRMIVAWLLEYGCWSDPLQDCL